ncbi:MAG: SpoIID/LytB domain-containing protein, partial [Acidobacteria bacterium]|nr:SpoIID/LytB domain-containing protein [Acidobacteriota bacterium]
EAEVREVPSPATLVPLDGGFVQVGDTSYRGRLVLRATGRGTLHVINEVNLEDYLKGVVPGEMGPRVYDEIEALKAQTIAARSYAIRRLGSWAREGYDLCATPRCQVYSGVNVEQPLSSQAVDATAGEVLVWNGTVCDTLFTSTCGGRTEFANEVFPGYSREDFPYLASVRCFGEGAATLSSTRTVAKGPRSLLALRGAAFLAFLEGDLGKARKALREGLGLEPLAGPKSLAPESFYRDLAKVGELFEPEILTEELETAIAPAAWSKEAKGAYATLSRFQLGSGAALPTERALTVEEAAGLYLVLLTRLGDVEELDARFLSAADGRLELKTAAGRDSVELLPGAALFRGGPDTFQPEAALDLVAGDRVKLLVSRSATARRAFALVGPVAAAHGTYERASSWIHWTRRFTGEELAAKLNERDSSRSYERVKKVEVLSRGVSGRATKVRVETDKDTLMLSGLEIRFALGVPESLFRVVSGKREGIPGPAGPPGSPLFTFYGRGWGHGIGLCQNGAFGMALAGKTYREIVEHYYPGASVGPVPAPD